MGLSLSVNRGSIMKSYIESAGGLWRRTFSFRKDSGNEGDAKLYPFSSSLEEFINNDDGIKTTSAKKYSDFLKSVPSIKIRGYYPNTALNEIFSLFGKMDISLEDLISFKTDAITKFFENACNIVKGLARPNSTDGMAKNIIEKAVGKLGLGENGEDYSVYSLPYALYYALVSQTNNAIYEIPCNIPSGFFDSNGNYGWDQGDDQNIFNAGGFLKKIVGMFHFTTMPFFVPGTGGEGETINVKFDLINDTEKSALANYTFMQTLMLNNKWMQYGITQLPGSVYDVKIAGGQRYFMCTGDFKVSTKGVMRSLGKLVGEFKPYGTETKIPDVYSFDLTFKSLLPNNLNNYLFGIAKQNGGIKFNGDGNKPDQESVFSDVMEGLVDALKGVGENQEADEKAVSEGNNTVKEIKKAVEKDKENEELQNASSSADRKATREGIKAMDEKANDESTIAKGEEIRTEAENKYEAEHPGATEEDIKKAGEKAKDNYIRGESVKAGQEKYNAVYTEEMEKNSSDLVKKVKQQEETVKEAISTVSQQLNTSSVVNNYVDSTYGLPIPLQETTLQQKSSIPYPDYGPTRFNTSIKVFSDSLNGEDPTIIKR